MKILEVKNLTKHYKQGKHIVKALDDVSFSVNKGEFVAIVGPSGSGKSTLLHMIGCVDQPTSGLIEIDGFNTNSMNEEKLTIFRRRHIGLIYQFYNLIPILNVEENIQLPVQLDQGTLDEVYYKELITQLGLEDRLNHLPNQLSGGQQQRVSIGRAFMNKPSLVLADEPTGNLDQESSKEIIELLKYSNKYLKQTIILITHDENIARQVDRVITIEDGKIIKDVNL